MGQLANTAGWVRGPDSPTVGVDGGVVAEKKQGERAVCLQHVSCGLVRDADGRKLSSRANATVTLAGLLDKVRVGSACARLLRCVLYVRRVACQHASALTVTCAFMCVAIHVRGHGHG